MAVPPNPWATAAFTPSAEFKAAHHE
jgi:hypothetical protein